MYKELQISSEVPAQKLKRAFNGGTLTLTKAELSGSGATLHLHPASYVKALKARKDGKGTRLQITHKEIGYPFKHAQGAGIYGGSIWGKIWSGIKSGFNFAKKSGLLSPLADMAATAAAPFVGGPQNAALGRQALRQLTGIGFEDPRGGRISYNEVKEHARKVLGYAKRKGVLTDIADASERYLLTKATKPEHTQLIQRTRKGIRDNFGIGVAGSPQKLVKGSQAAKDHMANLRGMRKPKGSKTNEGTSRAQPLGVSNPKQLLDGGSFRLN